LAKVKIAKLPVLQMSKLEKFCKENKPEIAVLCIPKESAGVVCDALVKCGVKAFWNFSHYDINLHFDDIIAENVHMGDSLLTLVYNVNNKRK